MDGFTTLTYPATGGVFQCPDAAVEVWVARGWQPLDAPATGPVAEPQAVVEAPAESTEKSAAKPAPTKEK